jgi:hypothetical protein
MKVTDEVKKFPRSCGGLGALLCVGCGGDMCVCPCGGQEDCPGCEECATELDLDDWGGESEDRTLSATTHAKLPPDWRREGMVVVVDSATGQLLGCMGRAIWDAQIGVKQ